MQASEVADVFLDLLPGLVEARKLWVLPAALELFARHPALQERTVKALRQLFNAADKSTRSHFLPNALSLNSASVQETEQGIEFDVSKAQVHG